MKSKILKIKRLFEKFKKANSHGNSKPLVIILYEYIKFKLTAPVIADQYFSKYLFIKGVRNYNDYLLGTKLFEKSYKINNENYFPALFDKYNFSLYFRQKGLNALETFAHNERSVFFSKNKISILHNPDEFFNFLRNLKDGGIKADKFIIKKTRDSWGGKNIFKIDLNNDINSIKEVYEKISQSSYIIQRLIVQHQGMSAVNPYSVNTLRFTTYNNKKEIRLLPTLLRSASEETFIDNISSGGGYVGLDDASGTLKEKYYTSIDHGKGEIYSKHPQTNILFKGHKIPFFKESKKLALDAAHAIPEATIVGWDIAVEESGPVLIEGNIYPDLLILEVLANGAKNDPVFMELIEEIRKL
ncbi:MAG TPA: sugar-transfer associated ATP-grasp domain-containing protein [Bacteroidales bacterium]|nr:sugar-transfer associated ATP-grasp domain-containing protein [Bacteroidales bacterium]